MRRGQTLVELLMVLAIFATLCGIALPAFGTIRDRAAVHIAAEQVLATLAAARRAALLRSTTVSVVLDPARHAAFVIADRDTIMTTLAGAELTISLAGTRDTIRYAPNGRGYGASNSSLILTRGAAADTVFVSRLGRAR